MATSSLSEFIDHELLPRLSPELVYKHPAHKWQQRGRTWKGGCPWHESKSGNSFVVNEENLLWWCEGCQCGGDVFGYLSKERYGTLKPRGTEFIEIVKELCGLAGVTFPEREMSAEETERASAWETRRALLSTVSELCCRVLWSERGEPARAYLHQRGFDDDAIRTLRIGLYPTVHEVKAELRAKKMDIQSAQEAFLLWSKLEGFCVFPWNDAQSRPLTLYAKWPSKQLPLQKEHPGWAHWVDAIPDQPITKTLALKGEGTKSSPLYFDYARRAGHNEIVAMEGVTDAGVAQVFGMTQAIAFVAAQFSAAQVQTLARYNVRSVTIVPDPDGGGDRGALSCIRSLTAAGIAAYVAPRLPDGLDPDEFILRDGIDAFRSLVKQAVPGHIHQAKTLLAAFDMATEKGKLDATQKVSEFLAEISDPRLIEDVLRLTSDATGYSVEVLQEFLKLARTQQKERGAAAGPDTLAKLQESLSGLADVFAGGLRPAGDLTPEELNTLFARLYNAYDSALAPYKWWLGDAYRLAKFPRGEKEETLKSWLGLGVYNQVRKWAIVCGKWPVERRRPNLPWWLHEEIGKLDEERQDEIFALFEKKWMGREAVRKLMQSPDTEGNQGLDGKDTAEKGEKSAPGGAGGARLMGLESFLSVQAVNQIHAGIRNVGAAPVLQSIAALIESNLTELAGTWEEETAPAPGCEPRKSPPADFFKHGGHFDGQDSEADNERDPEPVAGTDDLQTAKSPLYSNTEEGEKEKSAPSAPESPVSKSPPDLQTDAERQARILLTPYARLLHATKQGHILGYIEIGTQYRRRSDYIAEVWRAVVNDPSGVMQDTRLSGWQENLRRLQEEYDAPEMAGRASP